MWCCLFICFCWLVYWVLYIGRSVVIVCLLLYFLVLVLKLVKCVYLWLVVLIWVVCCCGLSWCIWIICGRFIWFCLWLFCLKFGLLSVSVRRFWENLFFLYCMLGDWCIRWWCCVWLMWLLNWLGLCCYVLCVLVCKYCVIFMWWNCLSMMCCLSGLVNGWVLCGWFCWIVCIVCGKIGVMGWLIIMVMCLIVMKFIDWELVVYVNWFVSSFVWCSFIVL